MSRLALTQCMETMYPPELEEKPIGLHPLYRSLGVLVRSKQKLAETLKHESAVVRAAAGRALCRMDDEAQAVPVLVRELKSEEQWVRLNVAIVLDSIGDKARPVIEALRQALQDKENKYVVRVANHTLNVLLGTNNKLR